MYGECLSNPSRLIRILLLTTLALCLAACGRGTAGLIAKGEELLAKRKFHDALMQFRSAVESDSSSAAAHWGLARSYENLGQFNEALEALRKTTELDAKNLDAKARLGNYFLLVQPPLISEAEKIQEEITASEPKFVEGHVLKASIMTAQQRPADEIIKQLNSSIAIDPARTETYLSLARYFMSNERPEDAEAAIKRGIAVNPNKAVGLIEYGRFLSYAKRDSEAEAEFKKAIAVEGGSIEAREALADFYVVSGQNAKAESEYKALVEIQENSPESRLVLAEFYAGAGRRDDAIAVLDGIVANSPEYVRARYKLGEIHLDNKDLDKVAQQLEALFAINDHDAQALMLRSRMFLQQGKSDEAIEDLESILKKQPSQREALFLMSQAKISVGALEQARAFIADLERYHPTYLRSGLVKVQAEFASGNAEEALKAASEMLTKVAAAAPNADTNVAALHDLQTRALSSRGLAYLELAKMQEAKADLEKVIELTPNSPAAMVNLAKLYTAMGDGEKALGQYRRALEADIRNFDAVNGLVNVSISLGLNADAKAVLEDLLGRNAGRADVLAGLHFLKSQVFAAEKNVQAEEAEINATLALDENYLPAYTSLAAIFVARNQIPEAIDQYNKVVAKKPSPAALTMLGILEDALGDRVRAEANYRRALEISPDTPIAANNLAWLIIENQGNLDEALQLASLSVAKNQTVAGFYDTLGYVYLKKGLHSNAAQQLRKAIALDQKAAGNVNPGYRVRLGLALASSGDKVSARREIETGLQRAGELTQQEINDARKTLATL
jgi:tetratricopeptide (TPR) repeat protein